MKETDLYEPIKVYLESLGYTVKGEVGAIDVFAMKNEESIAIELKNQITLKLIYQAIERQKIADDVYIAIPNKAIKSHQANYRSFMLLLRRLSIGLIVVQDHTASVLLDPADYDLDLSKKRNKKKHSKLVKEFSNRNNDLNIGGSKGKRMTVYKEKAILIAQTIHDYKILSPKIVKEMTGVIETSSILQKNYYGWFYRVRQGLYALTDQGISEIENIKKSKTD
ncbi:MAG: hypothetical protein K9L02_03640 [Acholeplasmataceae bacterium]|nr:hypothetical protein [Acholeplasmataceae bacterium]